MSALPWHKRNLERLLGRRERMPHALLVTGPAGIGKTEFARELAQGLLCEEPQGGLACGHCPSCHWFAQASHPDYREIVPEASEEGDAEAPEAESVKEPGKKSLVIRIDQIRAVGDFVTLTTHRAGFRVLVIRPAEALQPAAANALLKTLEEPPPSTVIVLVSDRPSRLLPTIRSRCQLVALSPPPREESLAWLQESGADDAAACLALAGGAPLFALELSASEERAARARMVDELARPEGARTLAFAAGVDRPQLERLLFVMQTWVHDLLRVKCGAEPRFHLGSAGAIGAKARRAPMERLLDLDRELTQARRLVTHPLNPRLAAEHLLAAYNQATLG